MPTDRPQARESELRIVLWGPAGAGKTAALAAVKRLVPQDAASAVDSAGSAATMSVVARGVPRDARGFAVRVVVATLARDLGGDVDHPGLLLDGVDGIVFLADSRPDRQRANGGAMAGLLERLRERGVDPAALPMVIVHNHRDRGDVVPVATMNAAINPAGCPWFLGAATEDQGIAEAVEHVLRRLLGDRVPGGGLAALLRGAPRPSPAERQAADEAARKDAASWAGMALQSFCTHLPGARSIVRGPSPRDRGVLVVEGGDPAPWSQTRELRMLGEHIESLRTELARRIPFNGWPIHPSGASHGHAWDLYWLSRIDGEILALSVRSPDERPIDGVLDADVTPQQLARWQRAGVRDVLIVGNGIALEPRFLAAAGFRVTALDASALATHVARLHPFDGIPMGAYVRDPRTGSPAADAESFRRPGGAVDFVVGDLATAWAAPGPFDLVVGRRVFQCNHPGHLEALDAALSRLRPGGFVVVDEHNMRRHRDAYAAHLTARGFTLDDGARADWTAILRMSSG